MGKYDDLFDSAPKGGKYADLFDESTPARAKQPPADAITRDELYSLKSSPETLKAQLSDGRAANEPPEPGFLDHLKAAASPTAIGGYATHFLNSASGGAYQSGRDWLANKLSPGAGDAAAAAEASTTKDNPIAQFASNAAGAGGYLTGVPSLAARGAGAAVGAATKLLPEAVQASKLARPVIGAATGALTGAPLAASEAGMSGANPGEMLDAAGEGAKMGGAIGGGLGAGGALLDRASEAAGKYQGKRIIADLTDTASATKRDRVVGKGGEKADRIVQLVNRTPDLEQALEHPREALPIISNRIEEVGKRIDDVYALPRPEAHGEPVGGPMSAKAVQVKPEAVISRLLDVADKLEANPALPVQSMAKEVRQQATQIYETWESRQTPGKDRGSRFARVRGTAEEAPPADEGKTRRLKTPNWMDEGRDYGSNPIPQATVDARGVRQFATSLGKNLFRGNPNADPTLAKQVRTEVYGAIVDEINSAVEQAKPGSGAELQALNAEMSDLLNMHSAVEGRAARGASPSTTLGAKAHSVLDWGLGMTNPAHLAIKKGLEHLGPGAVRGATSFLANSGSPSTGRSVLQEANPLLRALDAKREQDKQRAMTLQYQGDMQRNMAEAQKQQLAEEAQRRMLEQFSPSFEQMQ